MQWEFEFNVYAAGIQRNILSTKKGIISRIERESNGVFRIAFANISDIQICLKL